MQMVNAQGYKAFMKKCIKLEFCNRARVLMKQQISLDPRPDIQIPSQSRSRTNAGILSRVQNNMLPHPQNIKRKEVEKRRAS